MKLVRCPRKGGGEGGQLRGRALAPRIVIFFNVGDAADWVRAHAWRQEAH